MQLAGNRVVPCFLFCFHFLPFQRPKLQVLDGIERKSDFSATVEFRACENLQGC